MSVDLVANDFGMLEGGDSSTDVAANDEFASLADFSIAITMDTVLGTSTLDIGGYLMSSAFTGEVRYDTIQSLEVDAAGMPTAGEIRITGAEDATVAVTFPGAGSVQLDIDLNGDGTVDEVATLSWTELTG